MSTSKLNQKCRRMSSEQASPRAVNKNSKKCIFAVTSLTSSSTQIPSPPRRRDVLKNTVINAFRPRTTAVPQYRGVRHREELNKYVSEIRPTKCSKKIWLGTYDTAEEAARAFDIGNLCCKKNLPLNFPDSPNMLKKISSNLSPEGARNAIAKLAKEVARLYSSNLKANDDFAKQEPVAQAHSEYDRFQAFQPRPEPELVPQIQVTHRTQVTHQIAAAGIYSDTYIEQLPENVCAMEVATAMPVGERGAGADSRSWTFSFGDSIGDKSIGEMSLPDDLSEIINIDTPHNFNNLLANIGPDQMFEDHMYQDLVCGGQVYEDVIFYSH